MTKMSASVFVTKTATLTRIHSHEDDNFKMRTRLLMAALWHVAAIALGRGTPEMTEMTVAPIWSLTKMPISARMTSSSIQFLRPSQVMHRGKQPTSIFFGAVGERVVP
jgi:hypothetical protein